jgi:hypothetical protein
LEYEGWDLLTAHRIRAAREAGLLAELPLALNTPVGVHLMAGATDSAAALVEEADALARATGVGNAPPYGALALAAHRGSEEEVTGLVRTSSDDVRGLGRGAGRDAQSTG